MLTRILELFKVPSSFRPDEWRGRLSPLTFRRFATDDLPQCLELHELNENGRFPEGYIAEYRKCLTQQSTYHLVAEDNRRIIASGGISYWNREDTAALCF